MSTLQKGIRGQSRRQWIHRPSLAWLHGTHMYFIGAIFSCSHPRFKGFRGLVCEEYPKLVDRGLAELEQEWDYFRRYLAGYEWSCVLLRWLMVSWYCSLQPENSNHFPLQRYWSKPLEYNCTTFSSGISRSVVLLHAAPPVVRCIYLPENPVTAYPEWCVLSKMYSLHL